MTTSLIQRPVRIIVFSVLLVLAVFSFVAFTPGSTHAMSRPAASTGATTSVRIVKEGRFSVFSPSSITVKSGTSVKITNTTASELEIRTMSPQTFYELAAGGSLTITPLQSGYVQICGGYGSDLNITVV